MPSVGERPGRRLAKRSLAEVVEPRYEELFTLVQSEISRSGLEDIIASGIVFTGGASNVAGALN